MENKNNSKLSQFPSKAIALEYQDHESLPKVIASGQDQLARLIVEIARNAEIPIHENKELVALLDKQTTGPIISSKALKVLSEVMAFLYHADTLWKKQNSPPLHS